MNKAILSILAVLTLAFSSNAQDDGTKLAKSASKAFTSYNIDPTGNSEKLAEAKEKIDRSLKTPEGQALVSAWQTKGEVYGTYLMKDLAKAQIDPNHKMSNDNDAFEAFEGFSKALSLATKKYEKSDAIKGLKDNNIELALLNVGGQKYDAQEYYKAYLSFKASLECSKILKEAGEKSYFDDQAQADNYTYYAAYCAIKAGKHAEALPILEAQLKTGRTTPEIFDALFQCKMAAKDEAGAEAILAEGRKKFPDDAALLFSEINIYINKGKLSELTGRLEQAIAKEPGNVSLYVTLGSIYDNLYQKAMETKNEAEMTKNFEQAKKNYATAMEKDPKNVDATYSMGALYYNKAAILTKEITAMPDLKSEDLKKIEVKQKEVEGLFASGLPFFQKAESLDPNDQNTLVALKEIYTRQENDLALEFKKRLDNVVAGNKNATSYFKK